MKQEDSQFDLIFTITDVPPVEELGIELPIEATRPLDDCYQKIEHSVRSGEFVINVKFIDLKSKLVLDLFLDSCKQWKQC